MLRAKKPPPKVKDVKVRFSRTQYEQVVEAAQEAGLEVAVYCRAMVMTAAIGKTAENRLRGTTVKSETVSRASKEDTQETISARRGKACPPKKLVVRGVTGRTSAVLMAAAPDVARRPGGKAA